MGEAGCAPSPQGGRPWTSRLRPSVWASSNACWKSFPGSEPTVFPSPAPGPWVPTPSPDFSLFRLTANAGAGALSGPGLLSHPPGQAAGGRRRQAHCSDAGAPLQARGLPLPHCSPTGSDPAGGRRSAIRFPVTVFAVGLFSEGVCGWSSWVTGGKQSTLRNQSRNLLRRYTGGSNVLIRKTTSLRVINNCT